jgi:hypothetical protein
VLLCQVGALNTAGEAAGLCAGLQAAFLAVAALRARELRYGTQGERAAAWLHALDAWGMAATLAASLCVAAGAESRLGHVSSLVALTYALTACFFAALCGALVSVLLPSALPLPLWDPVAALVRLSAAAAGAPPRPAPPAPPRAALSSIGLEEGSSEDAEQPAPSPPTVRPFLESAQPPPSAAACGGCCARRGGGGGGAAGRGPSPFASAGGGAAGRGPSPFASAGGGAAGRGPSPFASAGRAPQLSGRSAAGAAARTPAGSSSLAMFFSSRASKGSTLGASKGNTSGRPMVSTRLPPRPLPKPGSDSGWAMGNPMVTQR